jgi:ABC-type nickel/cobalt efflux system permease component RcnA
MSVRELVVSFSLGIKLIVILSGIAVHTAQQEVHAKVCHQQTGESQQRIDTVVSHAIEPRQTLAV